MTWYCESCKKEVDVLASMGDVEISKNTNEKELRKTLWNLGDLVLRCIDCDSTNIDWI